MAYFKKFRNKFIKNLHTSDTCIDLTNNNKVWGPVREVKKYIIICPLISQTVRFMT